MYGDTDCTCVDSQIILYHLPDYTPTVLSKAKAAFSFAVNTSILYLSPDGVEEPETGRTASSIPTHVTQLAIGCRRKLVVFKWWDGEPQEPTVSIHHTPFLCGTNVIFAGNAFTTFTTRDSVFHTYNTMHRIFSLRILRIITQPVSSSTNRNSHSLTNDNFHSSWCAKRFNGIHVARSSYGLQTALTRDVKIERRQRDGSKG